MRRLLVMTAAVSLALVGCSSDDPPLDPTVDIGSPDAAQTQSETTGPSDDTSNETTPISSAAETETEPAGDTVSLTAILRGDQEVPGPGDPGASGVFEGELELLEASGRLCYTLEVTALSSEATAAHIHTGEAGMAGGVAVALTAPVGSATEECIDLDAGLTDGLVQNPESFYVNVHSAEFGDGAVRGQIESS